MAIKKSNQLPFIFISSKKLYINYLQVKEELLGLIYFQINLGKKQVC